MTVAVLPEDVAAGWRPLSVEEMVVAETQIGEALVLLAAEVPVWRPRARILSPLW
jgi:hypothetical protein